MELSYRWRLHRIHDHRGNTFYWYLYIFTFSAPAFAFINPALFFFVLVYSLHRSIWLQVGQNPRAHVQRGGLHYVLDRRRALLQDAQQRIWLLCVVGGETECDH